MIYLLSGEPFLVGRACRELLASRLEPALQVFNLDTFEGEELEAPRLLEAARSVPVLAKRRIVWVRRADEIRKREQERLEAGLPEIPESTDLIFTASRVDRRVRFWQKVIGLGKVQEFRPPYPREASGWISGEARDRGLKINSDAAQGLVEAVGPDPGALVAALEKISLAAHPRKEINSEDVALSVVGVSWRSVFDLTRAVGEQDLPRSLRLLAQMVSSGESLVALTALLARHYRTLLRIRTGDRSAVPPYFLKDYERQAARYRLETLSGAIERIFQADWDLKSSPLPNRLLMERLLWGLCRQEGRGAVD